MEEGLYELLVTSKLRASLEGSTFDELPVDAADEPHVVARHVAAIVERHLESVRDREHRIQTVNAILAAL